MSVIKKLINIYEQAGFYVQTSLNPLHFNINKGGEISWLTFTSIKNSSDFLVDTGQGITFEEIYFLENLFEDYKPQNVFIIGNAFGWSTFALSLILPKSKIVAIDAGIEGTQNKAFIDFTNNIAQKNNLNLEVVYGFSPQDTKKVIENNYKAKPDFCFIDGFHTNEQLLKDFWEIQQYSDRKCVYLLHDVINWGMLPAFNILSELSGLNSQILHRTTSGMGILYPDELIDKIEPTTKIFSESSKNLQTLPSIIPESLFKLEPKHNITSEEIF